MAKYLRRLQAVERALKPQFSTHTLWIHGWGQKPGERRGGITRGRGGVALIKVPPEDIARAGLPAGCMFPLKRGGVVYEDDGMPDVWPPPGHKYSANSDGTDMFDLNPPLDNPDDYINPIPASYFQGILDRLRTVLTPQQRALVDATPTVALVT